MTLLRDIASGDSCRLLEIGGEAGFRRRLLELGLVPGTHLRVVRRVPVGGLVELEVRRCRVTLRTSEADQVHVEKD